MENSVEKVNVLTHLSIWQNKNVTSYDQLENNRITYLFHWNIGSYRKRRLMNMCINMLCSA